MLRVKNQVRVLVNKRGFTLTEILVVIALIGVLLMFIMPNLIKIFSNSVNSTMKVQESEMKDAGVLYLEDYCKNPILDNTCPSTIKRNSDKTYSGYISLERLVIDDYIDDVSLEGESCTGCVIYTKNKAEAFLICGEDYSTKSSTNYKTICNIN